MFIYFLRNTSYICIALLSVYFLNLQSLFSHLKDCGLFVPL